MRNRQSLISKHRVGMSAGVAEAATDNAPSEALVAAAVEALNDMGSVVSGQSFARPDALTHDGITAYALALMRLRECAQAASLERLMKACDALAITVSHLIEGQTEACREHCETLTRFVAHAEAMIRMATERAARHALPIADLPAADAHLPLSGHA